MSAINYIINEHIKKKNRMIKGTATTMDYLEDDPIDMLNAIAREAKKK